MNEFALSVGSLLLGVIGSALVSRHYFRKSFRKELTPYLQFFSSPLTGIDPSVRRELKVTYQGQIIENLCEVQLLIANTGDKAIRDVVEPLAVSIPDGARLLDAAVMYASPEGRRVELAISDAKDRVAFLAPLLNSGDFFIAKLLLDGSVQPRQWVFTIAADELPPRLHLEHLPSDALLTEEKPHRFEGPLFVGALVIGGLGAVMAKLVVNSWPVLPAWSDIGAMPFVWGALRAGWAQIVCAVPAVLLIVIGVMMLVASLLGGSFSIPRQRRFVVPKRHPLLQRTRFLNRMARWEAEQLVMGMHLDDEARRADGGHRDREPGATHRGKAP